MSFEHVTVLLAETVRLLEPAPGRTYADVTLGGGGHAEAILEASSPDGQLIGMDRDEQALAAAKERLSRFGSRASFVHGDFSELRGVLESRRVHGVVADLGVSSPQVDCGDRGFSFNKPGPLDMRMDQTRGATALELIQELDERALADVIYQYGEERRSRPIARSIKRAVEAGEIKTTEDLRRAVVRVTGPRKSGNVDPATRTFQAIRIAVNHELDQLETLLHDLPDVLEDEGVAAIISFHSLEDRLVKRTFRDDERLVAVTKKPIIASEEEVAVNARARSAKLRGARRAVRTIAGVTA